MAGQLQPTGGPHNSKGLAWGPDLCLQMSKEGGRGIEFTTISTLKANWIIETIQVTEARMLASPGLEIQSVSICVCYLTMLVIDKII